MLYRYTRLFFLTLGVVAIILSYAQMNYKIFEHTAALIGYPFYIAHKIIIMPIQHSLNTYATIQTLRQEVAQLTIQNQNLLEEIVMHKATARYQEDTQELRDYKKRYTTNAQIADVIAQHFSPHEHYILVNAGNTKNIQPDMVAVYKNCLVGRVTQVYRYYSKVVLITDAACPVAAQCCKTGAQGIHKGLFNFECTTLTFVGHLDTLQQGDLVVSSGQGTVFPRGFALGTLHSFELDGLCYRISIKPLIPLQNIQSVYLLEKGF